MKNYINPTHPYLQLHWENLPGENWKEIPFGDGFFEISDMGRVRAHEREILSSDGRTIKYKAHIVKQQAIRYPNETIGDSIMHLRVHLRYRGASFQFYIHRMVFMLFSGRPAKLNEHLLVLHRNDDYFDNRISNLYAACNSAKTKLIYQKKRAPLLSTFLTAESRKKGITRRLKPVSQYDMNGNKIAFFESIKMAANSLGISSSSITAACKLRGMASAGGYLWHYGNGAERIETDYYKKFINRGMAQVYTPVSDNAQGL